MKILDKKLRELKKRFENEIPVSFTDRDRQKVLVNINQKKEKSGGRINHFLPVIITAVMITTLLFIFNHQFNFIELGFSNGSEDDDSVRSNILLENVVSEDGEEYKFEQIPWFSTKQKLIDSGHIPSDIDDLVTIKSGSDGEDIILNDHIMFNDPQFEASVIYKFQHGLFIGGEYIVVAKDDDDLVRIGTDLRNKVSEHLPDPIEGTLDGLSEDTIREIRHGNSQGASWWKGDNNIDHSSFEIGISKTADGEGIIRLSVRPPKLPEELEKELIEKGYLSPNEEGFTDAEENIHEITHETTIELSDELLEIYSQYEFSLDDLLLKDLGPIDIFKLYHHANQVDNQDVVYALFNQDGTYDIPDKETYFDDIAYAEDEVMKNNGNKYYEELKTVNQFNEVYTGDHDAVITYSTDSSDYDQFFQLIKDNRTNVWKVSWMPIQ